MTFTKSRLAIGAFIATAVSLMLFASACGGGGSSSSSGGGSNPTSPLSSSCSNATSNCATLTTDNGLGNGYVDGAFTSVTVCQPGTTSCVTIGGVLVDTGSVGLRLLKSTVSSIALTPAQVGSDALLECYPFVDSYMWGPVATADIKIAGETASNAPVMLVDDTTPSPVYSVPTTCSNYGGTSMPSANSLSALEANGILGIGSTQQDCGTYCTQAPTLQVDAANQYVGLYYDCASTSSCTGTAATLAMQVPNSVSRFSADNNGTAISLPAVGSTGTPIVTGALYFGIGTQTNNTMPSTATVLTLDANYEQFITTNYKDTAGQTTTNAESYIDSGSNGFFFVDPTSTCPNTTTDPYGSDWFCPSSTLSLSATNVGANGNSSSVSFSLANANTLFNTGDTAFANLGGPGTTGTFDWGLPFFFGRVVYNGIEGSSAANTGGTSFTGPFVAY